MLSPTRDRLTHLSRFALAGLAAGLLAALPCAAAAELALSTATPYPVSDAAAGLERLRALAGQWRGESASGKQVLLDYEVAADGSVVIERFRTTEDGPEATMVTVYHQDGEELMLTHYCRAGNQPTMRARAVEGNRIRFELSRITNLAAPGAGHMRKAVFTFRDDGGLTTEWTWHEDGEDRFTEVIRAHRVPATER